MTETSPAFEVSRDFSNWTCGRDIASFGTNDGSLPLAFQNWRSLKEAFTPELIREAIGSSTIGVRNCIDPFGGSGTTALACQFLGVDPTTIEVNPFLADLIEAKLSRYSSEGLVSDLSRIIDVLSK